MRLSHAMSALLVSAAFAGTAFAQAEGPSERTLGTTADGKRIVSMVIYGDDPCPEGTGDEIVVCARQPERERYRVPKQFRKPDAATEKSWADRASTLNTVGNSGVGSCSPVGPGGASGCHTQTMRAAKQAKKQQRAEDAEVVEQIDQP